MLDVKELKEEDLKKITGGSTYESCLGIYEMSCTNPDCYINSAPEPTCFDPTANGKTCPVCRKGIFSCKFTPYGDL